MPDWIAIIFIAVFIIGIVIILLWYNYKEIIKKYFEVKRFFDEEKSKEFRK